MGYESLTFTPEQVKNLSEHLCSVGTTIDEVAKSLSMWAKFVSEVGQSERFKNKPIKKQKENKAISK
nr:MAG TPA: hypothetical protein [Caudoviricetes sp.]